MRFFLIPFLTLFLFTGNACFSQENKILLTGGVGAMKRFEKRYNGMLQVMRPAAHFGACWEKKLGFFLDFDLFIPYRDSAAVPVISKSPPVYSQQLLLNTRNYAWSNLLGIYYRRRSKVVENMRSIFAAGLGYLRTIDQALLITPYQRTFAFTSMHNNDFINGKDKATYYTWALKFGIDYKIKRFMPYITMEFRKVTEVNYLENINDYSGTSVIIFIGTAFLLNPPQEE